MNEFELRWHEFLNGHLTITLKSYHDAVSHELTKNPTNVANNPDFKVWAQAIEGILKSRGEIFIPIKFP